MVKELMSNNECRMSKEVIKPDFEVTNESGRRVLHAAQAPALRVTRP
jgi:hypothetical protein